MLDPQRRRPWWRVLAKAALRPLGPAVLWLATVAGLNADLPGFLDRVGFDRFVSWITAIIGAAWTVMAAEPIGTMSFLLWAGTVWHLFVVRPREQRRRGVERHRRRTRQRGSRKEPAARGGGQEDER